MATASFTCSLPFAPLTKSLRPTRSPPILRSAYGTRTVLITSMAVQEDDKRTNEGAMSIDNLRGFVDLNVGKWTGSFHQFDGNGTLLHKIDTRLSASSYGEDELLSLNQSLYIKQPTSATSVSEEDEEEAEWVEYKIKETNMFTVDKYQQIGFFHKERAFSLRYQTAGMLDTTLRQGVLGEDDTGEESPRNLKLPSRRPALVCENCLYSTKMDRRARAFHIMDPKGVLEMLIVFLEERGLNNLTHPVLDNSQEDADRITPFLGAWKGRSVTKRSGVYGATLSEADTVAVLEMNDNGHVVQDITSTSDAKKVTTNVHWEGELTKNVVTFAEGYQMTLLPGGLYMGCPCDVAKSVAELKSFHLEFCWLESPTSRQRLVRTYDHEGLAVSSTYFSETKM
ncbi:PREDICTED: uncharacterized protein LOC104780102 isoform X2 [Camelina sativa]|uniref:Uncharacterized protein LOC104780102 isoform X1 n=1 Tax=Camelina sativa TaxID=90675 RepID=A0ABM0YLK7_CAMSA|nr:PREDICTED: uncharacterized protein LOC104780102 isoform X1 [Camelina sativa]XP_010502869.1 PREDICTED: uncharacterized protein LOC104780102 isoform X2 [Camelina sativa]